MKNRVKELLGFVLIILAMAVSPGIQVKASAVDPTYTIEYDCNYPGSPGSNPEAVSVQSGSEVMIGADSGLDESQAQGYVFTGWYINESEFYDNGALVNTDKLFSSDDPIRLTAGWCQTISVTVDGETTVYRVDDSSITPLQAPAPENDTTGTYTFSHWTLNGVSIGSQEIYLPHTKNNYIDKLSGTVEDYNIGSNNPNAVFVSHWKPDSSKGYLIRIQNDTDYVLQIQDDTLGTTVSVPAKNADGEKTVAGIHQNLNGYQSSDGAWVIRNKSLTFTALDPADFISYNGKQVQCYTATIASEDLYRRVVVDYSSVGDNWEPKEWIADNGNTSASAADVIKFAETNPGVPGKTGYQFLGWKYTYQSDGKETEISSSTGELPNTCATIYAAPVWGGTISFVSNYPDSSVPVQAPGTISDQETGKSVTLNTISLSGDESKKYRFLGWSENKNASAADYTTSFTVDGDAILYGVWSPVEYQLTWQDTDQAQGGAYSQKTYQDGKVPYGTGLTPPSDPEKAGYVFQGWNGYQGGMTMPAKDTVITAEWEPIVYMISYDANGGTWNSPITDDYTYYYQDSVTLASQVPVRIGYTFGGWEYNGNTFQAGSSFQVPETDSYNDDYVTEIVLNAVWTVNEYMVKYDGDGTSDNLPSSHKAGYGTSVTAGSAPDRKGYLFQGWLQNSTGQMLNTGASFFMPAQDELLLAKWRVAYSLIDRPGTYYLLGNQSYSLGSGLKAQGDSSVYSGGITFYIPEDGYYTFTE